MIGSWSHSVNNWLRVFRSERPLRPIVSRPFRGYRLEELETRWNPTTFTVDTFQDIINPSDGLLSLREAFQSAQANQGDSDIQFATALFVGGPQTLTLTGTLTFPDLTGTVRLLGPGADKLTISGGNSTRLFQSGSSAAVIQGVTLADGKSIGNGGAILNSSSMTLLDSVIRDSNAVAISVGSSGGGVANFGSLLIQNTAFVNNRADQGGGLANFGSVTVINSTFAANRAGAEGGAISNQGGAVLRHVTVAENLANTNGGSSQGGGIYNAPFGGSISLHLFNSIVASNQVLVAGGGPSASDIEGGPLDTASANNIIAHATTSGGLVNGVNGNQIGVNPKLMGLQFGPSGTPFFALFGDSPAIDAGDDAQSLDISGAPLATDQLGLARLVGAAVDIGAVESVPLSSAIVPGAAGADFDEGDQVIPIDPLVQLVVDSANQPLVSATVTPVNFDPEDFLTILPDGLVDVAGNTVTVSGRVVASFIGGGTDPLQFQFVSDITLAEAEFVLRRVAFGNLSDRPTLGPRLVQFKITDASLAEATAFYSIHLVGLNDGPRFGPIPDLRVSAGEVALLQVEASDLDSDSLQFTLTEGSELGATIDATTGLFRWVALVPPGLYRFTVLVADDGTPPATESVSFLVEVLPVGVAPGELGLPPPPGPLPLGPLPPDAELLGPLPLAPLGPLPPGVEPLRPPNGPGVAPRPASTGVFLGTNPGPRPVNQQTPNNSDPGSQRAGPGADGPDGERAGRGGDERGPGGREGPGGPRGGPGGDRIRPEGGQGRVPPPPRGQIERGFQPPPEARSERQALQVLSRASIRSEYLSGPVLPVATPNSAVTSILDSDDTVTLIDELRRGLAPIVVTTPPTVSTVVSMREPMLIDEDSPEVEGEPLPRSEPIVEEPVAAVEPAADVASEESIEKGPGLLIPLAGLMLWVPWQRWRRRVRRNEG